MYFFRKCHANKFEQLSNKIHTFREVISFILCLICQRTIHTYILFCKSCFHSWVLGMCRDGLGLSTFRRIWLSSFRLEDGGHGSPKPAEHNSVSSASTNQCRMLRSSGLHYTECFGRVVCTIPNVLVE
jgi:hypothetical protein